MAEGVAGACIGAVGIGFVIGVGVVIGFVIGAVAVAVCIGAAVVDNALVVCGIALVKAA